VVGDSRFYTRFPDIVSEHRQRRVALTSFCDVCDSGTPFAPVMVRVRPLVPQSCPHRLAPGTGRDALRCSL